MSLSATNRALLDTVLRADFVGHLPPPLKPKPAAEQAAKDLSRAFAGFTLSKLCGIPAKEAAEAVVDDYDDIGIDAIYYHAQTETLRIVQAKLKASETFSQIEANALCQGVRKLISQNFTGFNKNILDRQTEIEDAIENCSHIELITAHIGSGISVHANTAVADLISDPNHGEDRFKAPVDYDAVRVVADLQGGEAYPPVNATLVLKPWAAQMEPRQTYFGFIPLLDLIHLHERHGKALYAKNIRQHLGHATPVNQSIRATLMEQPAKFVYLNNGVTALVERIDPKENKKAGKRLKLTGVSIINGAQTVASSAQFAADNKDADISAAEVLLTLIRADSDSGFSKAVTRARNHQNPVVLQNFAALDDEQERLRRELAVLGVHYAYKAEGAPGVFDANRIGIEEATAALALAHTDPRYPIWLKKEPGSLLDTEKEPYKGLFNRHLTAFRLANAVRLYRYVIGQMLLQTKSNTGTEKLAYKHGAYILGFVLAKRLRHLFEGAVLIDPAKLASGLSAPFDTLRQTLWEEVEPRTAYRGPLAISKNQGDAIPLLRDMMINDYGLLNDAVVPHKSTVTIASEPYPKALFDYLASKAPQIGGLT